jgi:hypothetical protein
MYVAKIMTATVFLNRMAGHLGDLFAEKYNSSRDLSIGLYFLFCWCFWLCEIQLAVGPCWIIPQWISWN